MRSRKLSLLTLLLVLVCVPLYSQDYTGFKKVYNSYEKLMVEYTEKLNDTDDIDKISGLCTSLAVSVEKLTPDLKKVRAEHPELQEEIPAKLDEFFTQHMKVSTEFEKSLNKLTKLANELSDNEAFQKAYGKLNMAFYNMR